MIDDDDETMVEAAAAVEATAGVDVAEDAS